MQGHASVLVDRSGLTGDEIQSGQRTPTHSLILGAGRSGRFSRKQAESICKEQAGNQGKPALNTGQEQAGRKTTLDSLACRRAQSSRE